LRDGKLKEAEDYYLTCIHIADDFRKAANSEISKAKTPKVLSDRLGNLAALRLEQKVSLINHNFLRVY
jgi:hypothetical protein